MISGVWDEDLILVVAGHVPRVVELAVLASLAAEGRYEFAFDRENLNSEKLIWSWLVLLSFYKWKLKNK